MEGQPTAVDPDAQALEDLRRDILAVDGQIAELMGRRNALVEQYERHRFALYHRLVPAPVPGVLPPAGPRRSGMDTRALLLWLGAALLGISALTFSALAWFRLGDLGRAVLLLSATTLTAGLAVAARRRLPMTAEAFVGLTVVLALVDVHAVRRAGLGAGLSELVWWALGTAAVLGFAAALGRVTGRRTARFAVAALLPVPAVLLISEADWPSWPTSVAFAFLAAAIVYGLFRWGGWFYPEGRMVLAGQAFVVWAVATLVGLSAALDVIAFTDAIGPAIALASLAIAPEIICRTKGVASFGSLPAVAVSMVPATRKPR